MTLLCKQCDLVIWEDEPGRYRAFNGYHCPLANDPTAEHGPPDYTEGITARIATYHGDEYIGTIDRPGVSARQVAGGYEAIGATVIRRPDDGRYTVVTPSGIHRTISEAD